MTAICLWTLNISIEKRGNLKCLMASNLNNLRRNPPCFCDVSYPASWPGSETSQWVLEAAAALWSIVWEHQWRHSLQHFSAWLLLHADLSGADTIKTVVNTYASSFGTYFLPHRHKKKKMPSHSAEKQQLTSQNSSQLRYEQICTNNKHEPSIRSGSFRAARHF